MFETDRFIWIPAAAAMVLIFHGSPCYLLFTSGNMASGVAGSNAIIRCSMTWRCTSCGPHRRWKSTRRPGQGQEEHHPWEGQGDTGRWCGSGCHQPYTTFFKRLLALAGVAQAFKLKSLVLFLSGHMPRLQARSLVRGAWETTTHWCFSPSFSLPSPLSKNKSNLILKTGCWTQSATLLSIMQTGRLRGTRRGPAVCFCSPKSSSLRSLSAPRTPSRSWWESSLNYKQTALRRSRTLHSSREAGSCALISWRASLCEPPPAPCLQHLPTQTCPQGLQVAPSTAAEGLGDPSWGKATPLPYLAPTPLDLLPPYIPDSYGLPKHLYIFWLFLGWSRQRVSKTLQFGGLCLFNHALPFPCCQPLATLVILLACWVLCIAGLLWTWSLLFFLVLATHGSRASKGLSSQDTQDNSVFKGSSEETFYKVL